MFAGTSAEWLRIRMRVWERTGDERPAVADAGDGRRGGTGRLCASQSSNRRSPERRSSGEPPWAVAESLVNAERELWGGRQQLWLTSRRLLGYSAKLKDLRNPLRLGDGRYQQKYKFSNP